MEPSHVRMDPLALWSTYLDAAVAHTVTTSTDATLDPSIGPVSVVQVVSHTPADQVGTRRWSFAVSLTLVTYATDSVTAFHAHGEVADAILEAVSLDNGQVRVSSTRCTQEPEDTPVLSAHDWPGQLSGYSMYIRRED